MKIARIIANNKNAGIESADKIVILCGLDSSNRIIEGEWMGYCITDGFYHPFILRKKNELFFGDEENYYEVTNLNDRSLSIGEYFTASNQPGYHEVFQSSYQITYLTIISG